LTLLNGLLEENKVMINDQEEHCDGLNVRSSEFIAFIIAKIMSLPAVISIFVDIRMAKIMLSIYGFFIFLATFLCIRKMFFNNSDCLD